MRSNLTGKVVAGTGREGAVDVVQRIAQPYSDRPFPDTCGMNKGLGFDGMICMAFNAVIDAWVIGIMNRMTAGGTATVGS